MERKNPYPRYVIRAMDFMECFRRQRQISCMQNEIRGMEDQFGLAGLDGFMSDRSEDDQRLFVLYSDFDVGKEDFRLFE